MTHCVCIHGRSTSTAQDLPHNRWSGVGVQIGYAPIPRATVMRHLCAHEIGFSHINVQRLSAWDGPPTTLPSAIARYLRTSAFVHTLCTRLWCTPDLHIGTARPCSVRASVCYGSAQRVSLHQKAWVQRMSVWCCSTTLLYTPCHVGTPLPCITIQQICSVHMDAVACVRRRAAFGSHQHRIIYCVGDPARWMSPHCHPSARTTPRCGGGSRGVGGGVAVWRRVDCHVCGVGDTVSTANSTCRATRENQSMSRAEEPTLGAFANRFVARSAKRAFMTAI